MPHHHTIQKRVQHHVEEQRDEQRDEEPQQQDIMPHDAEQQLDTKGGMDIFVKTLTGRTIKLTIGADTTVDTVKASVHTSEGIPPHRQRLVYAGKELSWSIVLYILRLPDIIFILTHVIYCLLVGAPAPPR